MPEDDERVDGTDGGAADTVVAAAKARILVVDDEEEVCRLFSRGLARSGYDVSTAGNGVEALERLTTEGPFDLLLSDILMPRMRGDELQRRARAADPDLAVLLVTAAQDVNCAVECLREGAYDYILKPAPLSDVVIRVQKALERRRLVLENRDHQQNLERRVAEQAERIRHLFQDSLVALIHALDAKDENTRDHSARVAALAESLALRVRPGDGAFASRVRVAALFHDIGNIGVPDSILNKAGRLTGEEVNIIRRHPVIGEGILRPVFEDPDMLGAVRHHHERYGGGGYPDGLVGEAIPLSARIVAVADTFDALTQTRAYRQGMPPARALGVLQSGAESRWDARVVQALLEMGREGLLGPGGAECESLLPILADEADTLHLPEEQGTLLAMPPERPVLRLDGAITADSLAGVQAQLGRLLERGTYHMVLDLSEATSLDMGGAQVLCLLHQRLLRQGGRLSLRDATGAIQEMLQEHGLAHGLLFEQAAVSGPGTRGGCAEIDPELLVFA